MSRVVPETAHGCLYLCTSAVENQDCEWLAARQSVVPELAVWKHHSEPPLTDCRHGDFVPAACGVYLAFDYGGDIAASQFV